MADKTSAQVLISSEGDTLTKDAKRSGTWYTKVRTMRRDPTIALARQLSIAPLLAAKWSLIEKDNAPEGAKEFIESQIMPLRFHLLKTSLYGCIDFGWQPYEKVYEPSPKTNMIHLTKLKPLLQDFTEIRTDIKTGAFNGFKQTVNNVDVILEIPETLLVNFDVEGTNWYGAGAMEAVESAYDRWVVTDAGNTRYDNKIAGAHWIIHYPPGTSEVNGTKTDNYVLAKQLLTALEGSGSFVLPKTVNDYIDDLNKDGNAWSIELISADSSTTIAYIERMKYLDALKVRGFGLPERAVLEGQFGTKAEAEAHADFALTNQELRHQMLVQQYNWHLINQLLVMNYGEDAENGVYLDVSPITDLNLQFLRDIYKAFILDPVGFASEIDHVSMVNLRDKLGIPSMSEDERAAADADAPTVALSQFASRL